MLGICRDPERSDRVTGPMCLYLAVAASTDRLSTNIADIDIPSPCPRPMTRNFV